jgi:hypothetical protein
MDLSRDIEQVGDEILALFGTASFSTKLTNIGAEKNDGITLDSFRHKAYGSPNIDAEIPALYVIGLKEELIKDDGNCRWDWFKYSIEIYVDGDDEEKIDRKLARYVRCVKQTLLETYSGDGLITAVEYSPLLKNADGLFKANGITFQLKVFSDLT